MEGINVYDFKDDAGYTIGLSIVFDSDADRIAHAKNILNMEPKDGKRAYLIWEDTISEEDKENMISYTKRIIE